MGVSGSGKSTVGVQLARHLGWAFEDGDPYHPPQNIRKIAAGTPLTDLDRVPWLETLTNLIASHARRGSRLVLACSALKESYRRQLAGSGASLLFVYLRGAPRRHAFTQQLGRDRKSTRLNSSHVANSYAVFCLKKKN